MVKSNEEYLSNFDASVIQYGLPLLAFLVETRIGVRATKATWDSYKPVK